MKGGLLSQPEYPEYAKYKAFRKWYSINRSSMALADRWMQQWCPGNLIIDYGCGKGGQSVLLAHHGSKVVGVDISETSITLCGSLPPDRRWVIRSPL